MKNIAKKLKNISKTNVVIFCSTRLWSNNQIEKKRKMKIRSQTDYIYDSARSEKAYGSRAEKEEIF